MLLSELDEIIHRVVNSQTGAVIDVAATAERVLAELPSRLKGRVTHRQVRDRVFIASVRKAARSGQFDKTG